MSERRAWILKARPKGRVTDTDLVLEANALREPEEGEVRVRTLYLSLDPANRVWMNEADTYVAAAELGAPMKGVALAQVTASRHEKFKEGDLVTGMMEWADEATLSGDQLSKFRGFPGAPARDVFALMAIVAPTAYFGLFDVAAMKEGDVVTVSAAAGAVGSLVGQMAKLRGASRVVGTAGSDEKCAWLKEIGFDAAINYKKGPVFPALKEACPKGVDVHFENAGIETLEAAIALLRNHGRIALCGMISQYNNTQPEPGPRNLSALIVKRAKIEGFVVTDYAGAKMKEAAEAIGAWIAGEKLAYKLDVADGVESVLTHFNKLYEGANQGKTMVRMAEDADQF